jgi:hypothetical protein
MDEDALSHPIISKHIVTAPPPKGPSLVPTLELFKICFSIFTSDVLKGVEPKVHSLFPTHHFSFGFLFYLFYFIYLVYVYFMLFYFIFYLYFIYIYILFYSAYLLFLKGLVRSGRGSFGVPYALAH